MRLQVNVMKMMHGIATAMLLVATVLALEQPTDGQLRWPDPPKKAPARARLIALAWADPRSSYYASHEIFVAEAEVGDDEWKFIILVFNFLPYQPRLLHTGFNYSVVHEFSAWRDQECDSTVSDLMIRDWPKPRRHPLLYARDVPRVDLDQRRIPLPCYVTSADDYTKSTLEPIAPAEPPEPLEPKLKQRANSR